MRLLQQRKYEDLSIEKFSLSFNIVACVQGLSKYPTTVVLGRKKDEKPAPVRFVTIEEYRVRVLRKAA